MNKSRTITLGILLAAAAACLVASLGQPLWKMRMEAPQYRDEEALRVAVFPRALRGDLAELKTLNQYIGVHVPEALPQCRWLPAALLVGAVLPFAAFLLPRKIRPHALAVAPLFLTLALGFAALQAQEQMYEIGHKRDQKTVLVGVEDFTPPFLGRAKIAQFDITSSFGLGAWLAILAAAMQSGSVWLSGRSNRSIPAEENQGTETSITRKEALA